MIHTEKTQYHVGIDIGSTSTQAVVIDRNNQIIYQWPYRRHSGLIIPSLLEPLRDVYMEIGQESIASVSFTGNNAKRLAESLSAPFYWDAPAQVEGVTRSIPSIDAIISFGGQDAALLLLKGGELDTYILNSACAAGTGSFIDVQAVRMFESKIKDEGITDPTVMIERALSLFIETGTASHDPVTIATRCTVFAKTDIIHWGNAGKPQKDIIAGIMKGLVNTYMTDLVGDAEVTGGSTVIIGGGCLNPMLVAFFKEQFPALVVPEHAFALQAFGAALLSRKKQVRNAVELEEIEHAAVRQGIKRTKTLHLERAVLEEKPDGNLEIADIKSKKAPAVYLGIDIGSTTTKCVLLQNESTPGSYRITHKQYIKTEGRPIEAVKRLLASIRVRFGESLSLHGVATTGSGRYPVGRFIGADHIINEITAHALAAVHADPFVDTVFELGGQDSKYIFLKNGNPVDFNMNKICSAGTGSFLEEMAEKLKIGIEGEFQEKALAATAPVQLGDRCTVFMESGIASTQQQGASLEDICAGLALAVGHNYINRVVENRRIGERIMFLGGPSRNKAVVAAFEAITGATITVPANSEVFGAIGAALYARNRADHYPEKKTAFRGLSIYNEELSYTERICTVRTCSNECKLQVYSIESEGETRDHTDNGDGKRSTTIELIFGDRCGRYEPGPPGITRAANFFHTRRRYFESAIQDREGETSKPGIILPGHLYMHQYGPLFHTFFESLGFKPEWQLETTEEMIRLGTKVTPSNFCFSKIVSTGHLAVALQSIRERKNTYVWLPVTVDMPVEESRESGMFCPWTQATYFTLKHPFHLENQERVLHPVIHLRESTARIAKELRRNLGAFFGFRVRMIQTALDRGFAAQNRFERQLHRVWTEEIEPGLERNPAIVVVGRPYMLHDTTLNLRIGAEISRLGITAIPMDFLPTSDIPLYDVYPNMYWGEGAEILRAVLYCAKHPNLFPVIISNFGCGPDSFLSKYIEDILEKQAKKPFLEIELDAHSARAGMVTRLEAFHDVIRSYQKAHSEIAQKNMVEDSWQYQKTSSP